MSFDQIKELILREHLEEYHGAGNLWDAKMAIGHLWHLGGKLLGLVLVGMAIIAFLKFRKWNLRQPEGELPYAILLGSIVVGVCMVISFS